LITSNVVKCGTGSSRICFTDLAKSGSGRISQKQIRYSPSILYVNVRYCRTKN